MERSTNGLPISIKFHPFNIDKNEHVIEKAENGVKRKYLRGVSSGIMTDGHGERMTIKAIEDMQEQGRSGNVLLYAGLHGVNFLDDLGILVDSEIVNKQDWLTTYRLFDEYDEMPAETVGRANTLWKQINGMKPYKKPCQKGFSIEGIVPEEAILDKEVLDDGSYQNRVIDKVLLDGVVVVNRPAYEDSFVTAVYKCLGELPPKAVERLHKDLRSTLNKKITEEMEERNFFQRHYQLNNALEEKISDIMKINDIRNRERLEILMDEYSNLLIDLILSNQSVFRQDDEIQMVESPAVVANGKHVDMLIKHLAVTTRQLSTQLSKRIGR